LAIDDLNSLQRTSRQRSVPPGPTAIEFNSITDVYSVTDMRS
jgi:hypothetical protein